MNIKESSLFSSFSSVNRYNARDIADLTFLYLVSLHVLRAEWETAPFAKHYAQQTMAHGGFDNPHISNTDLYQLLNITLHHSQNYLNHLKNQKASETLIHDLMLDSHDVLRFLRNVAGSKYNDELSAMLLFRFERELRISVTNYKSFRRICSDWNSSHIDDEAKSLAITRLLQAMRYRAFKGDLIKPLQRMANENKLEIKDACDPETGKNCSIFSKPSSPPTSNQNNSGGKGFGLLKKLAVGAGIGVGAYYLGKALAGGGKSHQVKE